MVVATNLVPRAMSAEVIYFRVNCDSTYKKCACYREQKHTCFPQVPSTSTSTPNDITKYRLKVSFNNLGCAGEVGHTRYIKR